MDAGALRAFLDESEEALGTIAAELVELEAAPQEAGTVNASFRAIHSIKGNAPFFGLLQVKRLAHRMEDLLALLRERRLPAVHEPISSLLAGVDLLQLMLRSVRNGAAELEPGLEPALDRVLERLSGAQLAIPPDPASAWRAVFEQLDELTLMGASAAQQVALDALRATLVGLAPPAPAPAIAAAAEEVGPDLVLDELERLLEPSFDEVLPDDDAARVRELLDGTLWTLSGEARRIASRALEEHDALLAAAGFVPLLRETLLERLQEIRAALPPSPPRPSLIPAASRHAAPPTLPAAPGTDARSQSHAALPVPPAPPSLRLPPGASVPAPPASVFQSAAPSSASHESGRTMRVDEHKVDEFLDYVGELIITREMFGNVGKRLRASREHGSISTEFQRAMGAFTALSHDLQRSIMEVRKVPVKFALQKVPRLVRDAAESAGKQVSVSLVGGDVCIDKSLADAFEAPLIHMVRNAVDHGIESAEERRRGNKPPVGRVDVVVVEGSAEIVCSIRDDGAGIDADALCASAVRLGLLSESAAAQQTLEQAYQLVFVPGLSTARTITDVSGRGVGMDVVKRNVTERGGRIEVQSERGVGSTFTLFLPKTVTVQILDGFLVQVGRERLVLPLCAIGESFRPTPDQLHTVAERGECVSRRGRVFPLVRFNRLLALDAVDRHPCEAIVVSVQVGGGQPAGLLVDQVLGVQQVVLREVPGIDGAAPVFAGGAVLGDGRVAMVVDVEKLGALMARAVQA